MLLHIPDEDKKLLGFIIAHLRTTNYREMEPLDWSREDFVVNEKGDAICSTKT